MTVERILLAGGGKLGLRLARLLEDQHEVSILKRSPLQNPGKIKVLPCDLTAKQGLSDLLPRQIDYLIICLSPAGRSEQAYRDIFIQGIGNLLSALPEECTLKRIFFVSSTSVYGQNGGEWVDEASATEPSGFSGQVLLQAEEHLLGSGHPTTVVRFSGIYGGDRTYLLDQVRQGLMAKSSESRLSNRIHEDDCVGFLHYLLQQAMQGHALAPLYLASDSTPCGLNEVIDFIAEYLNLDVPVDDQQAGRRRGGNKRCRNARMLETGYRLKFPGYQEGYLEMLNKSAPG